MENSMARVSTFYRTGKEKSDSGFKEKELNGYNRQKRNSRNKICELNYSFYICDKNSIINVLDNYLVIKIER
jgi:hypothetical protein